jgi:hypothetical protein
MNNKGPHSILLFLLCILLLAGCFRGGSSNQGFEDGHNQDPELSDIDSDGIPNDCDIDQTGGFDCDFDGQDDNCQIDTDSDGTIDPCDPDLDGDGISNDCDVDQTGGPDSDGDGTIDPCEIDLTGEWIGTGTISSATVGNCPGSWYFLPVGHEYLNQIYLSQNRNELSGILGSSTEISGTIMGDTVSLVIYWKSPPIDDVTLTEYVALTALSCDYLVGTSLSELTNGAETCTITSSWELVKMDPCDSSG